MKTHLNMHKKATQQNYSDAFYIFFFQQLPLRRPAETRCNGLPRGRRSPVKPPHREPEPSSWKSPQAQKWFEVSEKNQKEMKGRSPLGLFLQGVLNTETQHGSRPVWIKTLEMGTTVHTTHQMII